MCRNSFIVFVDVVICLFSLLNGLDLEFLSYLDSAISAFCLPTFAWCNFPHTFIFKLSLSFCFRCVSWIPHWAGVSVRIIWVVSNVHWFQKIEEYIFALITLQDRFRFKHGLFQFCCLISLSSFSSVLLCVLDCFSHGSKMARGVPGVPCVYTSQSREWENSFSENLENSLITCQTLKKITMTNGVPCPIESGPALFILEPITLVRRLVSW